MNIMTEFRSMVNDWYKYMNTSIPKGVNGKFFTHVIYRNRERMVQLQDKYPELDCRVVENEAIRQYFKKNDEEIRNELGLYYGGVVWKDYHMKYTSSEKLIKEEGDK